MRPSPGPSVIGKCPMRLIIPSLIEYKFMIGRLKWPSLKRLIGQGSRVRSIHVNSQRLPVREELRTKLRPQVLGPDMSWINVKRFWNEFVDLKLHNRDAEKPNVVFVSTRTPF